MIVVDTNIIAYFWLPGEHTKATEKLHSIDPEWVAPLLWRSEFRNILAGYLRRKQLELNIAIDILEKAQAQFRGYEYQVNSDRIMQHVYHSKCTAYDCEFIALADDLNIPLYTADQKMVRHFSNRIKIHSIL